MVYQRVFQGVALLFLAGSTFAACGSDEPQTPQEKYCTAKCNCNKCTPNESGTCRDDIVNLADEARGANCQEPYDAYLTCLNVDGVCTDGDFDESPCFNEETDLRTCINPPPVCMTVDDGICNEPPPAGNGTCATGSDAKDCMPKPMCPTANDGICDEPVNCPKGSDTLDCPCSKCFTYALDQSVAALCETSTTLWTDFYACACGMCVGSCGGTGDICDMGPVSTACANCMSSLCTTPYNACVQDG